MALELYSGTQAVDGTEWSMTTDTAGPDADTTAGKYQPVVDAVNLAAGDVYQIALYEKARAADTQRLAQVWILTGAQASPLWIGPEVTLMHGWDFTLKKLAGSDRTITWSIRDSNTVKLADDGLTASKIHADAITEIQDGLATASSISILSAAVGVIDDYVDTEMAAILALLDTEIAAIKTVVDAILVDTGTTLDAALAVVDANVDSIKAKTDSLTYTLAGKVDANIEAVNGAAITGAGVEDSDEWRPA